MKTNDLKCWSLTDWSSVYWRASFEECVENFFHTWKKTLPPTPIYVYKEWATLYTANVVTDLYKIDLWLLSIETVFTCCSEHYRKCCWFKRLITSETLWYRNVIITWISADGFWRLTGFLFSRRRWLFFA